MNEVGARDEGVSSFGFTGVLIDFALQRRTAGRIRRAIHDVDDVVAASGELRLREEGQQVVVTAVAVDDQDLLAAVARHFVGGFLQEFKLYVRAVGDGSRLVAGFEDLPEIVSREDHGVFLLGAALSDPAHVDEVRPERQLRAMLLNDAEGEDARAPGLLDGFDEISGGEFLPVNAQELGMAGRGEHCGGGEGSDSHSDLLRGIKP